MAKGSKNGHSKNYGTKLILLAWESSVNVRKIPFVTRLLQVPSIRGGLIIKHLLANKWIFQGSTLSAKDTVIDDS